MTDETPNKGGRPPFKPTKAQRQDVMLMKACGTSEEHIAGVLGICRNTLRDYFAWELANGRAQIRLEIHKKVRALADEGNVSALRLLASETGSAAIGDSAADLGKKEAARLAARNPEPGTPLGDLMRRRQQKPGPSPDHIFGRVN